MIRRYLGGLFAGFIFFSGLSGQELRFSVENPSSVVRAKEPVVIPWKDVVEKVPGATGVHVQLLDEGGKRIPLQIDDMDFDGSPDELTFVSDFSPRQMRVFTLRWNRRGMQTAIDYFRTDAGNWKKIGDVYQAVDDDDGPGLKRGQSGYRFDGAGWESELVGYRIYLDERNAVDIQGKRKQGLYWNSIGSSGVDYQQDADWGMDVLDRKSVV